MAARTHSPTVALRYGVGSPACASTHVMKLAHHGWPTAMLSLRTAFWNIVTDAPLLGGTSRTPSWLRATSTARATNAGVPGAFNHLTFAPQ